MMKMMQKDVAITLDAISLEAVLTVPQQVVPSKGVATAWELVVFVHGSGSGRHSPRNQAVAHYLNQAGYSTLLLDLLTQEEDREYERRFDIDLLTKRVVRVLSWVESHYPNQKVSFILFGASTGAAAAIQAAVLAPTKVQALISRGGRVDLAQHVLGKVKAPTLLIVGGQDEGVLEINKIAFESLSCRKKLKIIPGASHLFEEPGALEEVAKAAAEWLNSCKSHPDKM